jgi:hypothetical protein
MIGQFRYASASGTADLSNSIVNISAFKISGFTDGAAIACCLYKWDAVQKRWTPYT